MKKFIFGESNEIQALKEGESYILSMRGLRVEINSLLKFKLDDEAYNTLLNQMNSYNVEDIAIYLDCYFQVHDLSYKDDIKYEVDLHNVILFLTTDYVNSLFNLELPIFELLNQEQIDSLNSQLLDLVDNNKISID